MKEESIIKNYELDSEDELDNTIRPETIDEYIGQNDVKENIRVFVQAAKMRKEPLDHVLLYGPPGLGKTTLAFIIAHELGANIKTASGPSIEKSGDLAAILSSLEPGDVLFIDEIHRIAPRSRTARRGRRGRRIARGPRGGGSSAPGAVPSRGRGGAARRCIRSASRSSRRPWRRR